MNNTLLKHPKITKPQFNEVMRVLGLLCEDTLREGRILDTEELREYARKILDMAGVDYTNVAGM